MSETVGVMFRLRSRPGVVVIEVHGDIDSDEARQIQDLALLAVADQQAVVIDLEQVSSLTVDAAAVLMSRDARSAVPKGAVTVRTGSPPARSAVLQAYSRRRVGQAPA